MSVDPSCCLIWSIYPCVTLITALSLSVDVSGSTKRDFFLSQIVWFDGFWWKYAVFQLDKTEGFFKPLVCLLWAESVDRIGQLTKKVVSAQISRRLTYAVCYSNHLAQTRSLVVGQMENWDHNQSNQDQSPVQPDWTTQGGKHTESLQSC